MQNIKNVVSVSVFQNNFKGFLLRDVWNCCVWCTCYIYNSESSRFL